MKKLNFFLFFMCLTGAQEISYASPVMQTKQQNESPNSQESAHILENSSDQIDTHKLLSRSNINFSAGFSHPFLRTGSLGNLGKKSAGKIFTLSYFPWFTHGFSLGLGIDSYGEGGELHDHLESLPDDDEKKLNALNFFVSYSYQNSFSPQLFWSYDLGLGSYQFTGIQTNNSQNSLFSLTQKWGVFTDLPEALQYVAETKTQLGLSFLHTWLPNATVYSVPVNGHNLGMAIHLRFVHGL